VIPVSIVTGFLGSGKTTLIARLLRHPDLARTAVIVNEWGEIGLDHELIAAGDDTLVALSTGCLCCRMRSSVAATLLDLERRREDGAVPAYRLVLIETSGLADPVPILQALVADPDVGRGHRVDSVLTLVDAVNGAMNLRQHAEARRQVALADRLLVTKRDLAGGTGVAGLEAELAVLNPGAPVLAAVKGDVAPEGLFGGVDPAARAARLAALPVPSARAFGHGSAIESFVLQRERPVPALALAMWLEALAKHCGAKLLRLKGLVEVEEMPGRPAVIQVVRHSVSEPEWLDQWPSADRQSRMVFICEGVPRFFPARLLEAIEEEVRDEMQRQPE
jgi:G3E family GTPase